MKKMVLVLALILALIFCYEVNGASAENLYVLVGVVNDLDFDNNLVIVVDCTGEEWAFEGIEDWCRGDIVGMLMSDNGTEIIYDDIILATFYNGYMEGWE